MKTKTTLKLFVGQFLSILLTSTTVFAITETRAKSADTYEKTESAYVISKTQSVQSMCEAGDNLVKGFCSGENRLVFGGEVEHEVFLDSKELKADSKNGWTCSPRLLHPEQIIRLESTVICQKTQTKT